MTFFQRIRQGFYSFTGFFKKHPILALTLIAAAIAATVFTGGTILLAAPAAIAVMTTIGAVVGGVITAAIGFTLGIAASNRDRGPQSDWPGILVLGGMFGGVGVAFAITTSPIAGLVFCGIGAVSVFTAICAGIGSWIKRCFNKPQTIKEVVVKASPKKDSPTHSYQLLPSELQPKEQQTSKASIQTRSVPVTTPTMQSVPTREVTVRDPDSLKLSRSL